VSDDLDVRREEDDFLERRRSVLLVPAILATCVGLPLIALSVLLHVVGEVVTHSHPEWFGAAGATYIPPSDSERARIIVRAAVPIIAGLGFLVLTWRFRGQGRRLATLICAVAVMLMGIVSLW
jgi:hypothetical protein